MKISGIFSIRMMAVAIVASIVMLSCTKVSGINPVNVNSDGVAIKGYDPVAYFTERKPVKGSDKYEYVWMGAKWRFASAVNRDMFQKQPEKYAPQFGGY